MPSCLGIGGHTSGFRQGHAEELKACSEGNLCNNLRTWRWSRTSPMPQDIKETIQFKHIDHEQVDEKQRAALRAKFKENLAKQNAQSPRSDQQCMKRVLQKSSRILRRTSWSTKLSLRLSFTLRRKACRDQEPGSNGEEFT